MPVPEKISELESRIETIEKRNSRVEQEKAWEGSLSRKLLIIISTYLVIAAYLYFIVKIDPWINAVVPAVGFLLSTLAFPFIKNLWIKYFYKK